MVLVLSGLNLTLHLRISNKIDPHNQIFSLINLHISQILTEFRWLERVYLALSDERF